VKQFLFFSTYIFLIFVPVAKAQVYINQAGYISSLPKYFYSNTEADSFFVIETATSKIVYRDEMLFSVSDDPATGITLYRGDFSAFQTQGNFYIRVGKIDSSFSFNISPNALDDAYRKSIKGYYFQRCGIALTPPFAGVYYHPSCHLSDATFHSTTSETGIKQATGGWHDAGDYGKYVVNAGITVGTLLMAYELFPGKFSQDNLNIPESGNFVPDILDEIRYELEWLLKMQSSDGGVYFKVTKENFESIVLPNNDSGTRYIYLISSTATGDFAAVMAKAARIYINFDPDFANKCQDASILAWNYLTSHPTIVPTGGFKNPSGTYTGEYGDSNDSDERLWAAAELYETTGNSDYKNYFELNYSSGGLINSTMNWRNVGNFANITYLTSIQNLTSASIKTQIKNSLINYCNGLVNRTASNGFGVAINPGEYSWGSNSDVLNKAVLLILAFEQTKNSNYYEAALMQLNYISGCNAHNISFITGVGTKSVLHPHHRPSWADTNIDPVPGLLAGGPDQFLDDNVLQSNFDTSTPPALCYIDNVESYASNEIAINWNAPLVFVLGYFDGEGLTNVDQQNLINMIDEFKLFQNYPNPFNSNTTIQFKINSRQFVTLKIYDLLGNEVAVLLKEEKPIGIYKVNFNISNFDLSSGIYFYRLQAGNYFDAKKMIYLK
jgi:endoglucanase